MSVASEDVQDRRSEKVLPSGKKLHDYVNLYICARNPMLFRLQDVRDSLTVLRIDLAVLDLPDAMVSDRNASADFVRFFPSPSGLAHVDRDLVFAEYWTHQDVYEYWTHKSVKCAEILIPDKLDPSLIIGAYVWGQEALSAFQATGVPISVTINRHLFFG